MAQGPIPCPPAGYPSSLKRRDAASWQSEMVAGRLWPLRRVTRDAFIGRTREYTVKGTEYEARRWVSVSPPQTSWCLASAISVRIYVCTARPERTAYGARWRAITTASATLTTASNSSSNHTYIHQPPARHAERGPAGSSAHCLAPPLHIDTLDEYTSTSLDIPAPSSASDRDC